MNFTNVKVFLIHKLPLIRQSQILAQAAGVGLSNHNLLKILHKYLNKIIQGKGIDFFW